MLWHVWQRALRSELPVLIAACESEVADAARSWGADVVLTDPHLRSGTDRVAAAIRERPADRVVVLQADEPLVHVPTLVAVMQTLGLAGVDVCTAAAPLEADPGPSTVKVVWDDCGDALYFSRSPIPYGGPFWQHLGLYGYRRRALFDFVELQSGRLERSESLEQLRLLESGSSIRIIQVAQAHPSVDTQQDLERVRKLLEMRA